MQDAFIVGTNANKNESSFLDRLIFEKQELGVKIEKLKIFFDKDEFNKLPPIQRELLKIQYRAMETYLECLNSRLYWLEDIIREAPSK